MNARKFFTVAAIAAGALSLAACGGGAEEAHEPHGPAPTVTVTAEPEVREVEVTPQACLDALDLADESFNIFADIFEATGNLDMAEVERLTATLQPDEYNALKLECQLAGEI